MESRASSQARPPRYLQRVKIESFGAFSGKVVGPFAPGLNVVFGRNEAGKTTLASFVGGVLFGWEDARGTRNTYKPGNAERAGSLFFSRCPEGAEAGQASFEDDVELSRAKNADGLQGDASLVDDIDKETFRTMFSLTSDELRSLRNTTDVTAKLLTAGSGTGASPAQALARVQERLAEYTSRAAGVEHSLVNLSAEQDRIREQLSLAAEEAERLKQEDKELRELEPQRADLCERIGELNATIEGLAASRAAVEKLDFQITSQAQELQQLREEEASLAASAARTASVARAAEPLPASLMRLTSAEERALRSRLDSFSSELAAAEHRTASAKENRVASTAAYEALLEAHDIQGHEGRSRRQRSAQIILSVALPVAFMLVGVLVFMRGRTISSLSFTALGSALILFSLVLAAGALVMLFRPSKTEEEQEARKQDLQWVMLQDKKKHESCLAEQEQLAAGIAEHLEGAGLGAAAGSLDQARALLDEAREARQEESLLAQRRQALSVRRQALEESLAAAKAQRAAVFSRVKLRDGETLAAFDAAIARKTQQRASVQEASERVIRRCGELSQKLAQAKHLHRFDELKQSYQQVRTRQNESAQDYARLLLAKRMLEAAIAAWESKSQPEVYRHASRLLADMTGGRWVKVSMAADGKLQVTDSVSTVRSPQHLSLSTCQQLYLALRIALLITAKNVGRAMPILADDILVNFDERRRAAAARALAELAQHRQVVLFTCHKEIVDVCAQACPSVNVVEL